MQFDVFGAVGLGHVGYVFFYLGCGVTASLCHLAIGSQSTVPTISADDRCKRCDRGRDGGVLCVVSPSPGGFDTAGLCFHSGFGKSFVADIFSAPGAGPANVADCLVGLAFCDADRITDGRNSEDSSAVGYDFAGI